MKQFHDLLHNVLNQGNEKGDRTGTGTLSTFGYQMRFDLQEGFPICTTKKVPFKAVLSELLWFLSGSTNVHDLRALLHGEEHRTDIENYRTIWDDNYLAQAQALGYTDGYLGPIYGHQWRKWNDTEQIDLFGERGSLDQITQVVEQIRSNPNSRRLIVSAWNPAQLEAMSLPPCHCLFQFYVHDGKLSCQLYQRSADVFLGVPFNIASYALLTHMIAQICNLRVGEFVWTGGDVHLYNNHILQANEMLDRIPFQLPRLAINPNKSELHHFTMDDFELLNYYSHASIAAPMAV